MNKWKIAFWCCLVVLIFIGTLSLYMIMDQSVTLTYQKEGYTNTENDLNLIIELN